MKVVGFDGRFRNWNLNGHTLLLSEEAGSSYHARARTLLAKLFPSDRRLEEVTLPGSKRRGGKDLRADFFLPNRRLIVEAHGQQHYQFILRFHETPLGFMQAQQRDRDKEEWCEINGFSYCALPWNEPDDRWAERILAAGTAGECG